ncbi:MAG: methyltransferase domain-containing protein [Anaerolineae bacterium]|nr:methyltransferase domain-containing protein [Anaerolineae bacterium]
MNANDFNADKYKQAAQQEWQKVAPGWHKWLPFISDLSRGDTNQMLDLAGIGPGHRVLDIAAGDGDQSLMAAERVGPDGYVLATDISSNLLAYADASAKEAGIDNFETRVMDAENLELEDGSFDAVICRNGLMLIPNVGAAMAEIYRVLKPGGRVSAIVFSTPDKSPWISIPAMIAMKHAKLPPPQPGMPGLFSLGAPGVFAGAFSQAGFNDVNTQNSASFVRLSSAAECIEFLQDIAGALHTILAPLSNEAQQNAWAEMEQALKQFENPDGFAAPSESIIGVGKK